MAKQRPIKFKIDVKKILKEHMFTGKKGTYLDCFAWPNKDGEDDYGNTHYVVQEVSREAREAGERGPIIGNLTLPEQGQTERHHTTRSAEPERQRQPEPAIEGMADDDIPF